MKKMNKNSTIKAGLEGAALLVALVGAFFLGQNVTRIELTEITSQLNSAQTANLIDAATTKDPFAGYEYVLIDNTKGIHKVQTR